MPNNPHEPTEENRKMVSAMTSFGITQVEICKVIGIDKKTLHKYYRDEIDTATAKANAKVANKLYQKCMDGDTTSIIFWLKTRARWSEKNEVHVSGTITLENILEEIDGTSTDLPDIEGEAERPSLEAKQSLLH